jgi:serine/threonine-protein kinase RsbW
MLDGQTVEVSLPNRPGYERVAMACSGSLARIAGLLQARIEDLKTAVSEACLNAMEHGNRGRLDARVIVRMSFKDGVLSVSVIDEGDGIKELPGKPDIERKTDQLEPPRGLGIYLIRQLVDCVEFNDPTEGGHAVKMVFKLQG